MPSSAEYAKRISLILASAFLAWQSCKLLGQIDHFPWEDMPWWEILIAAWVINMFVTGIFAFAGFALPTERLLPEAYYTVRYPKRFKRFSKAVGVERFRKFLLATVWRNKAQRKKYFDGTLAGLDHFDTQAKKSEFGHLLPFILINIFCIYSAAKGYWLLSLFCFLWNFIGNFYPILLQRHHRMRTAIIRRRRKVSKKIRP